MAESSSNRYRRRLCPRVMEREFSGDGFRNYCEIWTAIAGATYHNAEGRGLRGRWRGWYKPFIGTRFIVSKVTKNNYRSGTKGRTPEMICRDACDLKKQNPPCNSICNPSETGRSETRIKKHPHLQSNN